jgi:chorismate synthase
LTGILDGVPRGVPLRPDDFREILELRWKGYGRGGRRCIESDQVEVLSGVRHGRTLGTPVALLIRNRDFANWEAVMSVFGDPPAGYQPVTHPRPGHADLTGALKFHTGDLRDVIERASARELAMRIALSVIPRNLLQALSVDSVAWVTRIGNIAAPALTMGFDELKASLAQEGGGFLTPDAGVTGSWRQLIDSAREAGDTLGGSVQILMRGLPPGLGSFTQWDCRLDGRLAHALMSIPAVRSVEIGEGNALSRQTGSQSPDEIRFSADRGFHRLRNLNGGLEGGMTSGEILSLSICMKPLPSVRIGETLDMGSKQPVPVSRERSDVAALPALAIAAESVVMLELASAFLEKFGGDTLEEILNAKASYLHGLKGFPPG